MPGKNILYVRFFGRFSITYKEKVIVIDRNSVSKTRQLFQLLILNIKDGISKKELLHLMYGRYNVSNANASLNNTIFRLRKALRIAGLPESDYIIKENEIYYWDRRISVKTDVFEFKNYIEKGRKEKREKQLKYYKKAISYYLGEFLPNMLGEEWVIVENAICKELFKECAHTICKILMEDHKYEEVFQTASLAAYIYPFEDWQELQIDSLMAMNRYQEALELYDDSSQKAYEEMGILPSQRMMDKYSIMKEQVTQASEVVNKMKRILSEHQSEKGAYYCSFPSFMDIYHVFVRITQRKGINAYLIICTVLDQVEVDQQRISDLLSQTIQKSLRKGDFYTRYSFSQYLIMLINVDQENCNLISKRIKLNYNNIKEDYQLSIQIKPI